MIIISIPRMRSDNFKLSDVNRQYVDMGQNQNTNILLDQWINTFILIGHILNITETRSMVIKIQFNKLTKTFYF